VLPHDFYGWLFTAIDEKHHLLLRPSESYVHNVTLLGNIPDQVAKAGLYTARAVYRYHDWQAESAPLEFELVEDHRRWWPLKKWWQFWK
jgi:hypothetical protein